MIFICGNGGSATQADHFAGELIGDGIPCIALTNSAVITAIANDYGYEYVFSRQLEALGNPGDMVIFLTTSGTSQNIMIAALYAKWTKRMTTVLITGRKVVPKNMDVVISLPGNTQEIQEYTLMVLHRLWKGVVE